MRCTRQTGAERIAIAFYGATALVIELLLQAGVRYAASQPDLVSERGSVRR